MKNHNKYKKMRFSHSILILIVCGILIYNLSFLMITKSENVIFIEDFETGYDGWVHTNGNILTGETQSDIKYEGNFAFIMDGSGGGIDAYAGRYQHDVNITIASDLNLTFTYYFPYKNVSYIGYQIEFDNGKIGYYISFFSGWFVNTSNTYLHQYLNEQTNIWYEHQENIYSDYYQAFGNIPSDLHITSISMIMGDPYFTNQFQTAYFDMLTIS